MEEKFNDLRKHKKQLSKDYEWNRKRHPQDEEMDAIDVNLLLRQGQSPEEIDELFNG